MKTLDSTKSGACGDIVASRSRFGPPARPRVRHLKGRTPAQRRDGKDFGEVSSGWDELTEQEPQTSAVVPPPQGGVAQPKGPASQASGTFKSPRKQR